MSTETLQCGKRTYVFESRITKNGHTYVMITEKSSGRISKVMVFHDHFDMFRAALRGNEAYETVITDLGMPGIDGNQVARSIKAASPHTPIVMLTGWKGAMQENGESASEVSALVGKPAHASELNSLLLQLTAC